MENHPHNPFARVQEEGPRAIAGIDPAAVPWGPQLEKACLAFLLQRAGARGIPVLADAVARKWGVQRAYNLIARAEITAGLRQRPELALYDHTLQLVGGGQKYGCTIAHVLQETCNVTLLTNRPVGREALEDWYGLDLSGCTLQIVPLPFYESGGFGQIDPGVITVRQENPFHAVALASGRFDIFINNSMLEMVMPLSAVSVFICHFPERRKSAHFYVNRYQHLIYNSEYTAFWIRSKWGISPTRHIYPPADMEAAAIPARKEKIILSVARFEPGGSKQQERMVEEFSRLRTLHPLPLQGWKLVLAGGSPATNPYLDRIRSRQAAEPDLPLELRINISAAELKSLYEKARIFWHFCGLNQTDPGRVEHFGMTIVEAMQNGCVPVVFDGGGQREIVEQGISGFRFASRRELLGHTMRLIQDEALLQRISEHAHRRSAAFNRLAFEARIRDFFSAVIRDYSTAD